MKKVLAIVPAAGSGERMKKEIHKPYLEIRGKPILVRTLEGLLSSNVIKRMIILIHEEDRKRATKIIDSLKPRVVARLATGGKTRQESVEKGLKLIEDEELILIHDGVRPFVTGELVRAVLTAAEKEGSAIAALPAKETVKYAPGEECLVDHTLDRSTIWLSQTPQAFKKEIILKAYERAREAGYSATDDSQLVERIGGKVKIVPGNPFNIKITTPEDLILAELIAWRRDGTK